MTGGPEGAEKRGPTRAGARKATAKAWSAARRVTVPALVLHGGDDRIVLPYASRKLYEALASADKTLKIYEGLRHEIFNEVEREKVLSDVAEWLEKHT